MIHHLFRYTMPRRVRALSLTLCAAAACFPALAQTVASPAFLTPIDGKQALDWVHARDQRTLDTLSKNQHFSAFRSDALKILQSHDRIPTPIQINDRIYNFWRDSHHTRGILRSADIADYRTASPHWATVLDIDALAAREHKNWFFGGLECLEPQETRCMIGLSEGGEDAHTWREFDLAAKQFVAGGFMLPRAKQDISWRDADSLFVSRPWAPKDVTKSSYPYIVRVVRRGEKLDEAKEIFRGTPDDMTVSPAVEHDSDGHSLDLIEELPTFFTRKYFRLDGGTTHLLDLPLKSDVMGMVKSRLIVQLNEDWRGFSAGSVVAVQPEVTDLAPVLIVAPTARQSIDSIAVSRDRLLVTLYDNVRGQGWVYRLDSGGKWQGVRLALPDNVSVSLASSSLRDDTAFLEVDSFLTPLSLWQVDTAKNSAELIKHSPAWFDAKGLIVEQHEARSNDGTMVPYFVVRRADLRMNGKNPTLLYAYGGFQVSMTPTYSGVRGKLWLEQGGTYVLANIRGGGEFGPAWHEAGRKTNRQRVFDDFASVARDIIARNITSPEHLAIQGGSNGGLLMGVEFTQHPELWKGVIIQVPLLDMLNFETMSAGASWVDEYGSVGIPDQRAFLAKISPLENLKPDVRYAVPFITTTTRDDRVGPVHARRFAARMDDLRLPYFYYEQTEGGHSSGANQAEIAQEQALEYTYLWQTLQSAPH